MLDIELRPILSTDRKWLRTITRLHFGSEKMAVNGRVFYPAENPGFLALSEDKKVGIITFETSEEICEILLIDCLKMCEAIIFALLKAVKNQAQNDGCRCLRITTTNDNIEALRIYQRFGFLLNEIRKNAVTDARKYLKPEIPLAGKNDIPIRDEIDLELTL